MVFTLFSTCPKQILTRVFAVQVRKLMFKSIVIYNAFCSYQEQDNAIYDAFSPSEPQNQAKTMVFPMFLQQPKKQV